MTKVLVLYYSSYGHIETMAHAVAEGARAAGATVDVKRVPETVPEAVAKAAHFKLDQAAPIATADGACELRRDRRRRADAVRAHALRDGQLLGAGRRSSG